MGSGKQLSFAFGEVSPTLQYKVDASFYGQAASKIKNAIVRKTGGVSNRPGTFFFAVSQYQDAEYFPTYSSSAGIRIFSFVNTSGEKFIVEMRVPTIGGVTPTGPFKIFKEDASVITPDFDGLKPVPTDIELNLSTANFVQLGNTAIITCEDAIGKKYLFTLLWQSTASYFKWGVLMDYPQKIGTLTTTTSTIACVGQAPQTIPVSYLVTQELDDGSEVKWAEFKFTNCHPHTYNSSHFNIDLPDSDGVKQYNFYRSAGSNGASDSGHYALVGRVPPSGLAYNFYDFLVTPDITVQPPVDEYLYPINVAADAQTLVRKVLYYKQRTIIIYAHDDSIATSRHSEGEVGASKVGSPLMFGRPLTPNNIDAFSFTIPQENLDKITNALVMNRLILFTRDVTVAVRGGEAGVFTANTVNPEVIYREGCSPLVSPVGSGSRGYYVNYDRSKLLMINFRADDDMQVADVSTLSEHLFEARDIRSMAVTPGKDSVLWILKTDGTMLSLTISDDGSVMAFCRHETDGYIEDITVQNVKTNIFDGDLDSLEAPSIAMSVIRNGVRYIERMAIRDDRVGKNHRFMYMDCAYKFGNYAAYPSYYKSTLSLFYGYNYLNITTATTYAGGEELTLTDVGPYVDPLDASWEGKYIDFFYDVYDTEREEYYESKVRLLVTEYVNSNTLRATCEEDIPAYLQNIEGQTLSAVEKKYRQVRFQEAINQVTGLTALAGRDVAVYADGEIVSSPNDDQYDTLTVSGAGVLDLPKYYSRGVIGLPYETEIETLDLESSDSRTFTDAGKLINQLGVALYNTIGGHYGQTGVKGLSKLNYLRTRQTEYLDETSTPVSGYYKVDFEAQWEKTGKVLIKQLNPVPLTVLAVYPKGVTGEP